MPAKWTRKATATDLKRREPEPEAGGIEELFSDSYVDEPDVNEPDEELTEQKTEESAKPGFSGWRLQRPFGAGLLMILAGIVILMPAYLSFEVSNIQIQISTISGVSTLLIGVLLIACGLMTWFQREGRLLAGIAALILGFVALPTSNFGGFIIGTLFALIGGAWALSWSHEPKPKKQRQEVNE